MVISAKGRKRKGAAAEREFLNLLSQALGLAGSLARNLEQTRSGGADCLALPGLAIEIKRQETLKLSEWWKQAIAQAEPHNATPALAYRQSRQPWAVQVPLAWVNPTANLDPALTCTISLEAFAALLKAKPNDKT
jgi:hypothetical protein